MSAAQILKEINHYGYSNEELSRDYDVSLSTLSNYSNEKKAPKERRSPQLTTMEVVLAVLKWVASYHVVNPVKELREITLEDHMHINEFIKKYISENNDPKLVLMAIRPYVLERLKEKAAIRPLDKFREIYQYYNEETLDIASVEMPELVKEIILDESIKPFSRSLALYALALGARDEFFEFIKGFIKHSAPFMRESAFMALFEYYNEEEKKHLELKDLFHKSWEEEKADGIKKKIGSLLESM